MHWSVPNGLHVMKGQHTFDFLIGHAFISGLSSLLPTSEVGFTKTGLCGTMSCLPFVEID